MADRSVTVTCGERTHRVVVGVLDADGHRLRVSVDGAAREFDVRRVGEDGLSLVEVSGASRSHHVRIAATGRGALEVSVAGTVVPVEVGDLQASRAGGRRAAATTGPQSVVAPMPGKVVRLLVETGDQVAANQGVVIVEAMKMENELRAPRAGRVAAVRVTPGASVESGKVLIVIE